MDSHSNPSDKERYHHTDAMSSKESVVKLDHCQDWHLNSIGLHLSAETERVFECQFRRMSIAITHSSTQ